MRLRVGAVACLLLSFVAIGCRSSLNPNAISNQQPETWITAAPQETLTVKDGPTLYSEGKPSLLPVRFHLYWAGADQDGAVVGFWLADTGMVDPSLAPDQVSRGLVWHFTTRTDSVFTFKTSFSQPDRVHTIYICAMDDKGKIDPSPARLTFRAFDRFPPIGIIDSARAVGQYFVRGRTGLQPFDKQVTDTLNVRRPVPLDTVASGTRLRFRWHGEPRALGRVVSGFLYSIGDVVKDSLSQDQQVSVNTLRHGPQIFTLYTVGESDWRSKATRYFQMNFAPDTWFTGPNLGDPQWTSYADGKGKLYYYRDVVWSSLPNSAGIPNTMLSGDSVNSLPSVRPKRRTFLEFYGNRVWAHSEGDTVNLNSWVVIGSGGFDSDSPYSVRVGVGDVTHPTGAVTTPGPANASPVGFHYGYTERKTNHTVLTPSESILYPVFDRLSVLHSPTISAYVPMTSSGTVYFYTSAEDGDSTADVRIRKVGGPLLVSDHVDDPDHLGYVATQAELEARDKVMVFYVNHAPYLKKDDGQFFPNFPTVSKPAASIQRGSQVTFNILADDQDPVDYTRALPPGGKQEGAGTILARNVSVRGTRDSLDASGTPVAVPVWFNVASAVEFPNISFVMPATFKPGPAKVFVSVCDFRPADDIAGNTGRCSADSIDIIITGPIPSVPATGASHSISRPGSTAIDGRRKQP
jgi:hypothetical protein